MLVIFCKECRESIYLTPHSFWNITDFGAKCEKCETINTIAGNLKNVVINKIIRASITKQPM